jgi:hypothetical protein
VDSNDERGEVFVQLKENIRQDFEGKVAEGDLKAKGRGAEDTGYQGHIFRDLTNCSIISLVVNSQECSSAISYVLDCFKSLKDQK